MASFIYFGKCIFASHYTTSIPTGTNAGTYYVWYKAVGDENHTDTTPDKVAVTISQAEVTVTAENQSIYVNDTVPNLSSPVLNTHYTVTGLLGEDTLTTAPTLAYQKNGSTANPDNTTAGTYDIVPSGASAGDNYTIQYNNGTLTIRKKVESISFEQIDIDLNNNLITYAVHGTIQPDWIVCIAWYDTQGRMLYVQFEESPQATNTVAINPQADYYQLFLLNRNTFVPLCESFIPQGAELRSR